MYSNNDFITIIKRRSNKKTVMLSAILKSGKPLVSSVYTEEGPYKFEEHWEDDEDEDW